MCVYVCATVFSEYTTLEADGTGTCQCGLGRNQPREGPADGGWEAVRGGVVVSVWGVGSQLVT